MSNLTPEPQFATPTLRIATPADSLCLSALAIQVFLDTYARDGIRPALAREALTTFSHTEFDRAIADPNTCVVVAELNAHRVGFAQITLAAEHELAPRGAQSELLRLYVQEPFTHQQIGSKLLSEAESVAAAHGAAVLWLTPWVHNHRALAFYARRGYQDHGLTYFTFEGESHANRLFAKHLTSRAA
ncbi:MAG: GNAT family N-acetyltransferase [Burkholderiales bacterium]|nr:MAG: GNAT family N-acetyltransferase [Betaproteobacteria bacterium]TAG28838.1 MAG: GNAT family N-acetyltransferase [Burkholderiales bacterium]